jgi:hypothetical protein
MSNLMKKMQDRAGPREGGTPQGLMSLLGVEAPREVRSRILEGGSLAVGGFTLTRTGLVGELATEADWNTVGTVLASMSRSLAWLVGDWAELGMEAYGQKYEALAELTGLQEKTLRNYSYVARTFEMSRRKDKLSFKHHALVAGLAPDVADMWLTFASAEGWSVAFLREEIRAAAGKVAPELHARCVQLTEVLKDAGRALRAARFDESGIVRDAQTRDVLLEAVEVLNRALWTIDDEPEGD